MATTVIQRGDREHLAEAARRAGEVFAAGGLVVFPTETVYGIGASALSDRGYRALRNFKGRPGEQPFSIHLPDAQSAERYADLSAPAIRRLVRKVFPGPVTLVVEVDAATQARCCRELGLPEGESGRLYHQGTVGLRCPDDEVAQAVLGSVAGPVLASSANLRGQAPPRDADEAAAAVGDAADLVVDGGHCRLATPSTVVRINGGAAGQGPTVQVLREGVYDERFIRKLMRWTMLLVCSGNTCRSPMAAAIARDILARERRISTDDLETAGLRVLSAGVFAAPNVPASEEAVRAMGEAGLDLSRHRSRALTAQLIHEADVVYCMTAGHQQAVLSLSAEAAGKTHRLDPAADIPDPVGAGLEAYRRCAQGLRRAVEQRLKEQQP